MVLDALARRGPDFQIGVEAIRRQRDLLVTDDVTALDFGRIGSGEIQRDPLAPAGDLNWLSVHLQAAHAKYLISGQATHPLAGPDLAAARRAGNHDTMALQHESAVHREAEVAVWRRFVDSL